MRQQLNTFSFYKLGRQPQQVVRRAILAMLASLTLVIADDIKVKKDAPSEYTVVKGDTLWAISGRFLHNPWRWPQIWNMNRQQIKDPHWIYPGDVIVLDYSGGKPRLSLKGSKAAQHVAKLSKESPKIRISQLSVQAIPSIPAEVIEPFLSKPTIIDVDAFQEAPRIALGPDDRVLMAAGDVAYAVNLRGEEGSEWNIFSAGRELVDPESGDLLGYEVSYVGQAAAQDVDEVSTIKITSSKQEVTIGDRLILPMSHTLINYVPRLLEKRLQATVLAAYDTLEEAGSLNTVVINKGKDDGVDVGHVMFVYKAPRRVKKESFTDPDLYAPSVKAGNLFIYRVFSRVAYGLVLDSTYPVNRFDEVRSD